MAEEVGEIDYTIPTNIPPGAVVIVHRPPIATAVRRQRRRTPLLPRPRFNLPTFATLPAIFTIPAGQEIGESIRSFFEDHKKQLHPHIYKSVEGRIMSSVGDVLNPYIDTQGSKRLYVGVHSIAALYGIFKIEEGGYVKMSQMTISFQPLGKLVAGYVVGPLVAGCAVQVTLGFVKLQLKE